MRNHVTVVPEDRLVMVDYEPLWFDFEADENIHAIQWHNGEGEIEYCINGKMSNVPIEDYDLIVKPFVLLWEAEKEAINQANTAPTDNHSNGIDDNDEIAP